MRHTVALGLLFAGAAAAPGALSAQQRHGDVNGDTVVSALDAQAILTAVVGLSLPPGFTISNGDSDCDESTSAVDALVVLRFVIGLNTAQFCVGQNFGPGATVVSIVPTNDTTLLVNRGIRLRATLRDAEGFLIERPITWQTSNADLVSIDSARGDTAWVSNHFTTTGAADASATVSAFADGSMGSRVIKVFRSYQGIVITPQRPDTLRQLNGVTSFQVRARDSLGVLGTFTNAFFTTGNTGIATVPATASTSQNVTALTMGTTFLYAVSQTNPLVKDSVPLIVQLPPLNVCTGTGGTLHATNVYTTPQTWSPSTNPHYLTGTQDFNAGSRLTIEAGTLICTDGGFMTFRPGSRLMAAGTVIAPIVFSPTNPAGTWSGIQLGDFLGYAATPPADTSVLTNVILARGASGYGAVNGREQHVVLMDSVRIRQSYYAGVSLMSPGSRMIRSTIDTLVNAYVGYSGAVLGRGALEASTIRVGTASSGVQFSDAATIRDVTIMGGMHGIVQTASVAGARLNDISITGTSGVAMDLPYGLIHPSSGNILVSGGTGGAFRGQIGNLARLFPDSVAQQTLLGNGRDTIIVTGGTATSDTVEARPDLPWRVEAMTQFDTLSQLRALPGSRFGFYNGGFYFTGGGTLNAVGTADKFINFEPALAAAFYGLRFDSPGAGAVPSLAPSAVSRLSYVRLDSAQGQGAGDGIGYNGAISSGRRHRLEVDSAIIRKSYYAAASIAAPGSFIRRSVIDTTGVASSNFVSSQPALVLGDSIQVENTLVRRSGHNGIYAVGTGVDLRNVRVVTSLGTALWVENGILAATTTNVRADSANGYPFHGRIENLRILASTAAAQVTNFAGNVDSLIVVTGGILTNATLEAHPDLRWRVEGQTYVDTLAQFRPLPGVNLTFQNAGLNFQRGGTLSAIGTPGSFIRFQPVGASTWYGLRFDSPGAGGIPANAPIAVSTLNYVQIDSAQGQGAADGIGYNGAISSGRRHRLQVDSAVIRKSYYAAASIAAPGSYIRRSVIDTTGPASSGFVSSQPALVLGDTTQVENTLVRRSGQNGIYAPGTGVDLRNVRVVASLGTALWLEGGIMAPTTTNVRADSANGYPFHGRIENLAIVAATAASQATRFVGNLDSLIVVTGGNLTNATLEAHPDLRWRVDAQTYIDTLAQLRPLPGARLTFQNGGFIFQRGGTLNAVGTAADFIRFQPVGASTWYGLRFDSPGAGGIPANAPIAVSTLNYAQIDSAQGQSAADGIGYNGAISGGRRHRLQVDSAIIRKSYYAAASIAAPGSYIRRSVIDTTGPASSNFVASQPALIMGDTTQVENTLVRRSGLQGIYAPGIGVDLRNVRVVASRGTALWVEGGILAPTTTNVRADSANGYPFHGRIENLAIIAGAATAQAANFVGNVDSLIVVTGGNLTNATLEAHPDLRWRVEGQTYVDTLAQFRPLPGVNLTFQNAGLNFVRGGTLNAVGTPASFIRFQPVGASTWYGLRFDSPGAGGIPANAPIAVSTLNYVRIDSAQGQGATDGIGYNGAIGSGRRHRLQVDSAVIRKSYYAAASIAAPGSYIRRSVIDTTGPASSNFVASQPALILGDTVQVENTVIRSSGHTGIAMPGTGMTMTGVRVVDARLHGIHINGAQNGTPLSGFIVDSNRVGGVGVMISVSGVQLTGCDVINSFGTAIATDGSYTGVRINDCNILNNGRNGTGLGISNNNTTTGTYVINADDNFWGLDGTTPITPQVGTANGISQNVTVNSVRPTQRIP